MAHTICSSYTQSGTHVFHCDALYAAHATCALSQLMSHTNECVTVAHTSCASATERRAALSERHACRCVPLSVKDISTASSTESGTHHKGLLTHSISHV
mmetsp:Transcript_83536/g.135414  ORF Transcript_83536/g.135414 Transcript_83536/m.135414 type:complete len:99 (-) Transcript_83536:143-439(-)